MKQLKSELGRGFDSRQLHQKHATISLGRMTDVPKRGPGSVLLMGLPWLRQASEYNCGESVNAEDCKARRKQSKRKR